MTFTKHKPILWIPNSDSQLTMDALDTRDYTFNVFHSIPNLLVIHSNSHFHGNFLSAWNESDISRTLNYF